MRVENLHHEELLELGREQILHLFPVTSWLSKQENGSGGSAGGTGGKYQ